MSMELAQHILPAFLLICDACEEQEGIPIIKGDDQDAILAFLSRGWSVVDIFEAEKLCLCQKCRHEVEIAKAMIA